MRSILLILLLFLLSSPLAAKPSQELLDYFDLMSVVQDRFKNLTEHLAADLEKAYKKERNNSALTKFVQTRKVREDIVTALERISLDFEAITPPPAALEHRRFALMAVQEVRKSYLEMEYGLTLMEQIDALRKKGADPARVQALSEQLAQARARSSSHRREALAQQKRMTDEKRRLHQEQTST